VHQAYNVHPLTRRFTVRAMGVALSLTEPTLQGALLLVCYFIFPTMNAAADTGDSDQRTLHGCLQKSRLLSGRDRICRRVLLRKRVLKRRSPDSVRVHSALRRQCVRDLRWSQQIECLVSHRFGLKPDRDAAYWPSGSYQYFATDGIHTRAAWRLGLQGMLYRGQQWPRID
jgi:hypothetical protein